MFLSVVFAGILIGATDVRTNNSNCRSRFVGNIFTSMMGNLFIMEVLDFRVYDHF